MTEKNLSSKVVIVTGAGGGLGRAMVLGLAEKGARLALVDIDQAALDPIAKQAVELNGQGSVLSIIADVGLVEDSERIFEQTLAKFGSLHVLVNNAGIAIRTLRHDHMNNPLRFWEADVERWQRLMDVNFKGPFMLARQAAPHMIKQGWGRIVNVTTSLDTMLRRHYTPYGPSKAALEAASCAWAQELEGTGVSLNVLVPGGLANTGDPAGGHDGTYLLAGLRRLGRRNQLPFRRPRLGHQPAPVPSGRTSKSSHSLARLRHPGGPARSQVVWIFSVGLLKIA